MVRVSFLSGLFILWAGLILGVSFIATPAKFMAPHLTMPVALEIGKATFHLFNKIEWGLGLGIILLTAATNTRAFKWFFVICLLSLLLLETFWLLPGLDVRVDRITDGDQANPGILHGMYIILEVLKVLIALIAAWWTTWVKKHSGHIGYTF